MTRDQAEIVRWIAAECEARVQLLAAKPTYTTAEWAAKEQAICDEIVRGSQRIQEIILGGPCTPQPTEIT